MACSAQPAAACSASHPSARQPPARALCQLHASLLPLAASRPARQCPTFPSFLLHVLSFLASVNGARPKRPNTASRRRLCACKASAQITALRFPSIHRACTPIKPELDALPPPFLCSPSQSPLSPVNSPSRALNLDADVTLSSALFHRDRRCLPFSVLVTIRSNSISPMPSLSPQIAAAIDHAFGGLPDAVTTTVDLVVRFPTSPCSPFLKWRPRTPYPQAPDAVVHGVLTGGTMQPP